MWTMSVCGKKNQQEKERKRGILSSFRLRSAKSQIKGKKKNSGVYAGTNYSRKLT
jgi:hypothetical protein